MRRIAPHLLAVLLSAVLAVPCAAGDPSLAAMAGQLVMVGFRGLEPDATDPIGQDIRAGRVGGVILFDRDLQTGGERNIRSAAQVRALTARLQALAAVPLFVAVDQEGGQVRRLKERHGFPALAPAAELARGTPEATRDAAARTGRAMAATGLNLNFAPVLDLAANPDNPVISRLGRSFGADPETVASHAGAFAQGLRHAGVLTCCKHFPGHGSSSVDSHLGLPDVTTTWSPAELAPYRRLLAQGLCDMVMPGHLLHLGLDDRPASLSGPVIQGLLREQLGFDGVVVSDDLQMAALGPYPQALAANVRAALQAGADVLLLGNNLVYDPQAAARVGDIILAEVAAGRITPERIRQSWQRVMRLKARVAP